ncbi:MAG: flagellar hook-associated protein FlgK [Opitutus sp.]
MSGLYASLNSAVSALTAHSRAVEVAGKNLANVNNPNYARQRVIYGDRGTVVTPEGAQSLGLEALGVEQLRDALLDRQVVRESARTAYYQMQQNGYQRAQAALGQDVASAGSTSSTSTDTGIAAALDGMFNAFHSFAANPTDTGQRQTLLQSAGILTDRIQLADSRLAQVQSDLDAQVTTDVGDANRLMQTVADLNDQIARFEINHPGSAIDLRDQRQAALEKLSAKLPITTTELSNGKVTISSVDGGGTAVVLVSATGVDGPLAFDNSTNPPTITGGASATVLALNAGAIQGSIDARIDGIQTLRDQLDALAKQLVTSINGIYNPGGTSTDFLDASGTTAATISLAAGLTPLTLRASASGAAAGDNTVALAIAQLSSQKFSTTNATPDLIDGTFGAFFSGAVSGLGQALNGATARVNDQGRIEQLVRSQRDTVSGVSLDEEMADLMKYQRAFQASSRVFQTIDDLLEVVVNQMGR